MSHIAIYVPSLRGGGAERVMVTLANGFALRGHRVDLVLARAEGPYLVEVASGVQIVDLDKERVMASLLPLARYIRRERPDAMLSALNHANLVAIMARSIARSKIRLVVSERNSLTGLGNGRRGRLFRGLMRWLYPKADGVIALTAASVKELTDEIGLDPARLCAIPNPVDVAQFRARAASRPDHPWLAPDQPPVILAAGRLERQKDYPTLLTAFARLRTIRPARLVILGEGSLRTELQRQIDATGLTDDVLLAGFQTNPFGWMGACAVYAMSSRYEGFPNTLVQAMACGARVVSTDCPTGPVEILEDGRWGRLVPVGDAKALSEALETTLTDYEAPDVTHRVSEFRLDTIITRYSQVLGVEQVSE